MYAYPVCWVRYREPEPLPAVAKLKTLIASPKLFTLLRNVDKNGIGYVSRSEMIRTMAQLGYDNLSQITLLSMLKFFETKLEGQVNYINLLQYIHENTESQSLIHAESKIHCFCMDSDKSGLPNEDKIRALFAQIDSTGQGAFTLSDFSHFLEKNRRKFVQKREKRFLFGIYVEQRKRFGRFRIVFVLVQHPTVYPE